MGTARLNALVDGVFAIAITLLVLELPHPQVERGDLAAALLHDWPSYAAYLVAFVTVGLIWIEHHGVAAAIVRINRRLLERSLLFLLTVSLIPWPTALAAEHWPDGGADATTVAILFAATMLAMGLSITLVWRYLVAHPELLAPTAHPALVGAARRALLGSLVYIVAIGIAFPSPSASFAVDALIAVYFAISRTKVPVLLQTTTTPPDP